MVRRLHCISSWAVLQWPGSEFNTDLIQHFFSPSPFGFLPAFTVSGLSIRFPKAICVVTVLVAFTFTIDIGGCYHLIYTVTTLLVLCHHRT